MPRYIASKACHKKEYSSFVRYAKKNTSRNNIERLQRGVNKEDLEKWYICHTTGYGKPGGFISIEKTTELKGEIRHTTERFKAFRYTPLIHGRGH